MRENPEKCLLVGVVIALLAFSSGCMAVRVITKPVRMLLAESQEETSEENAGERLFSDASEHD